MSHFKPHPNPFLCTLYMNKISLNQQLISKTKTKHCDAYNITLHMSKLQYTWTQQWVDNINWQAFNHGQNRIEGLWK